MISSALRKSLVLLVIVTAALVAVPVRASDPVGIYALIDRVVLEPDAANPTAIQIWGVFALSDGKSGDNYRPPERGYLYYTVNTTNERATRAEWADFRAVAGTGQPIGFAGRYKALGRVRRAAEPPSQPEMYPLGFGLVKILAQHLGPTVERDLKRTPAPLSPPDGERVAAGPVKLVVRSVADPKLQYVFEIESASSGKETSPPIAAGRNETAWSPRVQIRRGESYTWRVWTIDADGRGPTASATFRGAI